MTEQIETSTMHFNNAFQCIFLVFKVLYSIFQASVFLMIKTEDIERIPNSVQHIWVKFKESIKIICKVKQLITKSHNG